MSFLDWLGTNLVGLFGLLVGLVTTTVSSIVMALQVWRTTQVQMKQIRPAVSEHRCRVCDLGVYTYFDENNKLSEPACVYLALDESGDCRFNPENRDKEADREQAKRMLAIDSGKCYLGLKAPNVLKWLK